MEEVQALDGSDSELESLVSECSTMSTFSESSLSGLYTLYLPLRFKFPLFTSVSDPSHFDVDPDPGIHILEKWIRILGSTFP